MQITAASDAELQALSELPGNSALEAAVRDLLSACLSAVPSCLAVRVTSPALDPGLAIESLGILEAMERSLASLRLDLIGNYPQPHEQPTTAGWPTAVTVLILASESGAFSTFVDGADRLDTPGFRIIRRSVDEDLPPHDLPRPDHPPGHDAGLGVVADHTRILNRAVGVLIDRGHLPDAALRVLHEQAEDAGLTVIEQARAVLATTSRPQQDL